MIPVVAPSAWAFDAGHPEEPMLTATATTATVEMNPITSRREDRITRCSRWLEVD
jgi:hypothetical protein